jgi:pimeloyl-ACP methyl ester carboxylesterase
LKRTVTAVVILGAVVAAVEVFARITRATHNRRVAPLGDRLFVKTSGSGDPILFIHGLRGSGRYWEPHVNALAGDHQVIVVDLLGFGESPWPRDGRYDTEEHIQWIRRTVEPLRRGRRMTVVGHSLGTIVAAEYARRHRDEVSALILLNAPMFRSNEEAKLRIRSMSHMAAAFSINRFLARASCDLVCAFRPLLYQIAPVFEPSVPPHVARDAVLHRWESFDRTLGNVVLESRLEGTLRSLKGIPMTIVHGTRDAITPRQRLESIAAETGARLVFIEGDHNMFLSDPDAVIAEIRRALQ